MTTEEKLRSESFHARANIEVASREAMTGVEGRKMALVRLQMALEHIANLETVIKAIGNGQ